MISQEEAQQRAWKEYAEELKGWSETLSRYHWDIHIVIRKGHAKKFRLWNGTTSASYTHRSKTVHRILGKLRCLLPLKTKQFNYALFHEFGPVGNAHCHVLLQIAKKLDKQLVYDALETVSAKYYKDKYIKTFYTKAKSKTELTRFVFIQSQENAINYVSKKENFSYKGFPLSKEFESSYLLGSHGKSISYFKPDEREPSAIEVELQPYMTKGNYLELLSLHSELEPDTKDEDAPITQSVENPYQISDWERATNLNEIIRGEALSPILKNDAEDLPF